MVMLLHLCYMCHNIAKMFIVLPYLNINGGTSVYLYKCTGCWYDSQSSDIRVHVLAGQCHNHIHMYTYLRNYMYTVQTTLIYSHLCYGRHSPEPGSNARLLVYTNPLKTVTSLLPKTDVFHVPSVQPGYKLTLPVDSLDLLTRLSACTCRGGSDCYNITEWAPQHSTVVYITYYYHYHRQRPLHYCHLHA